jgi:GntR family histidine utilization transcriptional repressor
MTRGKGAETLSLSQRIRADIEEKIMSGAWRPGDRIPVEHELAAQYGCARMTVTRATEALAEAGLIVRRKRAGSFVAQPASNPPCWAFQTFRRRSPSAARPTICACCPRGSVWRRRGRGRSLWRQRRCAGNRLSPSGGWHSVRIRTPLISLLSFLPRRQRISAGPRRHLAAGACAVDRGGAPHRCARAADARAAELLNIAKGAPCLMLERRTWRGDAHVTWVRQLFAADAFDLCGASPKGDAAG